MTNSKIFSDGKVNTLIRIDEKGAIQRTIHRVKLTAELGHYYLGKAAYLGPGKYGPRPKIITATGYDFLNRFAPLGWIPQATLVDETGREVGNPQIKKTADGCIEWVRIRRFAVGRALDGSMRCHDLTLSFEPLAYLHSDLISDFTGKDKALKGEVGPEAFANEKMKENKLLTKIPLAPGVFLVFDVTQTAAMKRFAEYRERTKFADRLARTLCERNIFAKHWGFRVVPEDGIVEVSKWESRDFSPEALSKGIVTKGGNIIIDGEEVKIEAATVTASEDDLESTAREIVNEDGEAQEVPEEFDLQRSPDQIRASLRGLAKGNKDFAKLIEPVLTKHSLKQADIAALEDIAILEELEKAAAKK